MIQSFHMVFGLTEKNKLAGSFCTASFGISPVLGKIARTCGEELARGADFCRKSAAQGLWSLEDREQGGRKSELDGGTGEPGSREAGGAGNRGSRRHQG